MGRALNYTDDGGRGVSWLRSALSAGCIACKPGDDRPDPRYPDDGHFVGVPRSRSFLEKKLFCSPAASSMAGITDPGWDDRLSDYPLHLGGSACALRYQPG